jgi:hypothetical protein
MRVLKHDGYARQALVRETIKSTKGCRNCGAWEHYDHALFRYGTERDDRPGQNNVSWHEGLFCSKSCHDSFHS